VNSATDIATSEPVSLVTRVTTFRQNSAGTANAVFTICDSFCNLLYMKPKQISPAKTILAGLGAIAVVGSLATAANGVIYSGGYTKDRVQIRTGTSNTTTLVGRGYLGDNVCLFYTATGQSNGGSTTWWWTRNVTRNKSGYSPASKLYASGVVSSC
jgi:hypothetical protein